MLPYLSRVNQRAIELGVQMFFVHICGDQNKNLGCWQRVPMGKRTVLSFGREVTLTTAMSMFPDRIIAGNVDPTLIQEGQPEEILQQARECIETAKHHPGGFVLMAGCEVPPQAPPVNLFQLVKASREFGRYSCVQRERRMAIAAAESILAQLKECVLKGDDPEERR